MIAYTLNGTQIDAIMNLIEQSANMLEFLEAEHEEVMPEGTPIVSVYYELDQAVEDILEALDDDDFRNAAMESLDENHTFIQVGEDDIAHIIHPFDTTTNGIPDASGDC